MRRSWLAFAVAMPMAWLAACSSAKPGLGDDSSGDGGSSGSGSGSGDNGGPSSGTGTFMGGDDATPGTGDSGPCKGGHYLGDFFGTYTSHLTGVGFPIPVAGDVRLNLNQEGSAGQQCQVHGEFEQCDNVFSLKDGTITGIADAFHFGDATAGGFPYFCTMTGTLDCKKKVLEDGWIQCTYCIGDLADGGMACNLLNGVGGTTGVGGHFAGPLTAQYDYASLAFVMGGWNGAEALAGNDGGSPGPDGGPYQNYLSDSGFYVGPGDFGGSGTWNAKYKP